MGGRKYFERREAEERAAAEWATDARARQSHLELAAAYRAAAGLGEAASGVPVDTARTTARPDLRII